MSQSVTRQMHAGADASGAPQERACTSTIALRTLVDMAQHSNACVKPIASAVCCRSWEGAPSGARLPAYPAAPSGSHWGLGEHMFAGLPERGASVPWRRLMEEPTRASAVLA